METHGLSASLEDYLEAIYRIVQDRRVARPKDITKALGVGSSSVTGALRALAKRGLIEYSPHELVSLTELGQGVAEEIVRRHQSLRSFLGQVLGVAPETAERDACLMEHALSGESFHRLVAFVEYVLSHPQWVDGWHGWREGRVVESTGAEAEEGA